MPKNWNRRFKHNRDKMKTGDIFELAEVVRNLSLRDHEKGLSTGEKQMFVKAKKILASELMYAKAMDEDEAAVWLDEVLSSVSQRQEEGDEGRRRRERVALRRVRACRVGMGRSRRRRSRRAARGGPAEGVRRLGGRPLLAESLERLEASDWIDVDRRGRAARVGGARDPARRGARLRQGRRRRSPAVRRAPTRCGSASARSPTTPR